MNAEWPEWRLFPLAGLADPGAREFRVGDGDWPFRGFVLRRGDGIRAYANICPHLRHPLNLAADGFLTSDLRLVRCTSHGALFEPDSGFCVAGPCAGRSLLRLPQRVVEGMILVRAPTSLREVPGMG